MIQINNKQKLNKISLNCFNKNLVKIQTDYQDFKSLISILATNKYNKNMLTVLLFLEFNKNIIDNKEDFHQFSSNELLTRILRKFKHIEREGVIKALKLFYSYYYINKEIEITPENIDDFTLVAIKGVWYKVIKFENNEESVDKIEKLISKIDSFIITEKIFCINKTNYKNEYNVISNANFYKIIKSLNNQMKIKVIFAGEEALKLISALEKKQIENVDIRLFPIEDDSLINEFKGISAKTIEFYPDEDDYEKSKKLVNRFKSENIVSTRYENIIIRMVLCLLDAI